MRGKITKKLIDSLIPDERVLEVRDTELKGFILRVQPSGVKTYICQYARGKRVTIGPANAMTPFMARELTKEVMAKFLTTGIDPMEIRKAERVHTLESFIAESYKPWVESNHRRPKDTLGMVASWYPTLGKVRLSEIKAWTVEKQRAEWLKAGAKPTTVNLKITYLKVALNRAVSWGLLQTNPLISVKRLKIDAIGIVRYLTDGENKRLRNALDLREKKHRNQRQSFNRWRDERGYKLLPECHDEDFTDHLKPLVLLALNTGLRRGELFNLKWTDIDFDRRMLTVQGKTTKSGKTRHVPLSNEALNILQRWSVRRPDTELVFPGDNDSVMNNVNSSWARLIKTAQIENFRFHDLRHDFASKLVMAGVDLNTIRELLGHSSITMTLRYAHLAPEKLASAIAILNA